MKKTNNKPATPVSKDEDDEVERQVELALLGSLPESMKLLPKKDTKNEKRMSFEQFAIVRENASREKTKFGPEPARESPSLKTRIFDTYASKASPQPSNFRSESTQTDLSKISKIEYYRNRVFCSRGASKPQSYLPQSSTKLHNLYQKLWNKTPSTRSQDFSRKTSPRVVPSKNTSTLFTPTLMRSGKSRVQPISPSVRFSPFIFSGHKP